MLTPLVQGGKGLGKRSAAQIALGYGLDYGISEATGMPALFSEEALAGVRKLPEQKKKKNQRRLQVLQILVLYLLLLQMMVLPNK